MALDAAAPALMLSRLCACCLVSSALIASSCAPSTPVTTEVASNRVVSAPIPRLKLSWRAQASEHEPWAYLPQEYARPIFLPRHDDLVVSTSNGYVSRLRAGSGELVWRVPFAEDVTLPPVPLHADPVADDERVYVADIAGNVQGRKLSTGERVWRYQAEDAVESTMVVNGGRLFFMDASEILYALDAQTGKLLWRYQRRTPDYFTIKGAGVPVIDGDAVYCGFADGTLAAVQIDTGDPIWTSDLTNDEVEFTDVDSPAIVSGDYVYAASYSGGIFALSRLDGSVAWQIPIESVSRFIKRGSHLIVVSAQGKVVSVDLRARAIAWTFHFEKHTPVEVSAFGPYLFVSTTAGPLTILDQQSGQLLTRWNPSQGFNTPVVFGPRRGFLLSNGGYLYGFEVGF